MSSYYCYRLAYSIRMIKLSHNCLGIIIACRNVRKSCILLFSTTSFINAWCVLFYINMYVKFHCLCKQRVVMDCRYLNDFKLINADQNKKSCFVYVHMCRYLCYVCYNVHVLFYNVFTLHHRLSLTALRE